MRARWIALVFLTSPGEPRSDPTPPEGGPDDPRGTAAASTGRLRRCQAMRRIEGDDCGVYPQIVQAIRQMEVDVPRAARLPTEISYASTRTPISLLPAVHPPGRAEKPANIPCFILRIGWDSQNGTAFEYHFERAVGRHSQLRQSVGVQRQQRTEPSPVFRVELERRVADPQSKRALNHEYCSSELQVCLKIHRDRSQVWRDDLKVPTAVW
jgi:hypothetical protein